MDGVITLVKVEYTLDSYGNQVPSRTEREVFCEVLSVTRTEYYNASQVDLHPEYIFRISHFKDYLGERVVLYTDWTGTEKRFDVVRTYLLPDSDAIELTVSERIGND